MEDTNPLTLASFSISFSGDDFVTPPSIHHSSPPRLIRSLKTSSTNIKRRLFDSDTESEYDEDEYIDAFTDEDEYIDVFTMDPETENELLYFSRFG